MNQAALQALRSGVRYELDVEALRGSTPIWVTMRGEAVRNAKGAVVGLRGTIQDITSRKRVEEELRAVNEELTRFNQVTLGRELRIIELKKQVNQLCVRLGQPARYGKDFELEAAQMPP